MKDPSLADIDICRRRPIAALPWNSLFGKTPSNMTFRPLGENRWESEP